MGGSLYREVKNPDKIIAFIDASVEKKKSGIFDKKVLVLDEAPDDGYPIIISPISYYQSMVQSLRQKGISAGRLIPLRFL